MHVEYLRCSRVYLETPQATTDFDTQRVRVVVTCYTLSIFSPEKLIALKTHFRRSLILILKYTRFVAPVF